MKNAVIIISQHDIPAAEEIAKTLEEFEVYVFDPLLVDKIKGSTLPEAKLFIWENCLEFPALEKWCHSFAHKMETELDQTVREIIPEVSIRSWQHLNFYYLLAAVRWYTGLWDEVLGMIPRTKVHVFMCDNPAHYYWPSFIPSLMLLQKLKQHGLEFSAYTYGSRPANTDIVPNLCGTSDSEEILVHLPTCIYDDRYIDDELQASGKKVINLQAKYWDVKINASKTIGLVTVSNLDSALLESFRKKIDLFSARILEKIKSLLSPFIATQAYNDRQSQFFTDIYESQLITYYLLEGYFKDSKPSKVIISDHDAGFHGPIYSFAKKHNIPAILIPHSKISHYVEFDYSNLISLSHPIQGNRVSYGDGRRVLNFKLAYPENIVSSSTFPLPLRKIGLVLNSLTTDGIFYTRYAPYLAGIKAINRWCLENDILLTIRCKPGQLIKTILTEETGIDLSVLHDSLNVTMGEFARNCDLCLMYDTPTSAALEFLRNSIPILNPIPEDISWIEGTVTNSSVVPRASVGSILSMLDSFVSDSINLFVFRNSQSCNYLNSFRYAYPLRHFL